MAGDVEECKSEALSELQKSYSQVFSELQTTKKVLASTLGKLSSKDLQVERLAQYNLSLRQEIEKLSEQIQKYRHPDRKDAQVQTDSEQTGPVDDDVAVSTLWNEDKEQGTTDTAVSIEDTLKATAEAVMQQTGFMYDETSGLYYDYNTNYYYDGEKSMYYDPTTGNYFYYDEADGQYVVHSQIDPARYKMYSHLIGLSKKEATNKLEADSEKRRESVKDSKKVEGRQGSELCSVETEERRSTKQMLARQRKCLHRSCHVERRKQRCGCSSVEGRKQRHVCSKTNQCHQAGRFCKTHAKTHTKTHTRTHTCDETQTREKIKRCSEAHKLVKTHKHRQDNHTWTDLQTDMLIDETSENKYVSVATDKQPSVQHQHTSTEYQHPSMQYQQPPTEYQQLSTEYQQPSTEYQQPSTEYQQELIDDSVCLHEDKTQVNSVSSQFKDVAVADEERAAVSVGERSCSQCGCCVERMQRKHGRKSRRGDVEKRIKRTACVDDDAEHEACVRCDDDDDVVIVEERHASKHKMKHKSKNKHKRKHKHKTKDKDQSKHDDMKHLKRKHRKHKNSLLHKNEKVGESARKGRHLTKCEGDKTHACHYNHSCDISSRSLERTNRGNAECRKPLCHVTIDDAPGEEEECTHKHLEPGELSSSDWSTYSSEYSVWSADWADDSDRSVEICENCDWSDEESKAVQEAETYNMEESNGGCWPPCIRAIVQKSDCLDVGTLFIVTCTGGSIGRDINMNHAIVIPDNSISEIHADVYFDYDRRCYVLSDRGSESGTLLNGKQISQSGVRVTHGDVLQLGHTHVSLHIHNSSDTCDACEPGQVRSQRAKQNKPEIFFTSKEDKMRAQREQLKEIKKKYGLKNSKYVDNAAAINNPAYVDKAELRRQTVGSDVPHAKTAATASVDRPLSEDNKGHRLLAKMGWKEGQGLGKDNAGRSEPITVTVRANSSAGLGSQSNVHTSLDNVEELERCKRWFQALLRYNNINKKDNSSQN